jgi:hypothetical protein
LDKDFFVEYFSEQGRQNTVIPPKKTQVTGSFGQKEKQLKKLAQKEKGKFHRIICEGQSFNGEMVLEHFNISFSKSRGNGIGVNDHLQESKTGQEG